MLKHEIRRIGDVTILDLEGRISRTSVFWAKKVTPRKLTPQQQKFVENLMAGLEPAQAAAQAGSGTALVEVVRGLVNNGERKIVLNLKDVTRIDSSGIGDLIDALVSVQKQGGHLKLLNPTPTVTHILRITRLYTVFEVKDDENSAIQSFSSSSVAAG